METSMSLKSFQYIRRIGGAMLLACGYIAALSASVSLSNVAGAADGKQEIAAGKIKFRDHAGTTVLSLKPKDDGAKLVDGDEKELARYSASGKKTKIKDADDRVLGYIVVSSDSIQLESADQKRVVCQLQSQTGGGWKIHDAEEKHVETIETREHEAEVKNHAGKTLGKIKVKGGKTELRDSADTVVYLTQESIPIAAMSCLGMEVVPDVRLRMGLLYAMDQHLKKEPGHNPK
jgi:hypothetical protein